MACIFLAAKIEESPRRLRDVINVFHHIKQKRSKRYVPFHYYVLCTMSDFFSWNGLMQSRTVYSGKFALKQKLTLLILHNIYQ